MIAPPYIRRLGQTCMGIRGSINLAGMGGCWQPASSARLPVLNRSIAKLAKWILVTPYIGVCIGSPSRGHRASKAQQSSSIHPSRKVIEAEALAYELNL